MDNKKPIAKAPSWIDNIKKIIKALNTKNLRDRHAATYGGAHAAKVTGKEK